MRATPPLIDSTIYFCSGLERCSKVIPVDAVISISSGNCGGSGDRADVSAEDGSGLTGTGVEEIRAVPRVWESGCCPCCAAGRAKDAPRSIDKRMNAFLLIVSDAYRMHFLATV